MKTTKRKVITVVAAFMAVTLTVVASAMGGSREGGPGGQGGSRSGAEASESRITVKLARPERGDIVLTTDYIGKIQPEETIKVYTEVQGKVTAAYFEEGQTVHRGDLLFEIDSQDMEDALEKAKAQYDATVAQNEQTMGSSLKKNILNAENSYNNSKNSYITARDNIDNLEDQLDEYWDAYKDAKKELDDFQGDESSEEYKELREAAEQAKSRYENFEDTYDAQYDTYETSKDNAYDTYQYNAESYQITVDEVQRETQAIVEANLRSAQLTYDAAVKDLEKCKVYAPADGVIESKNISVSDMATTSNPAYTITNQNTLEVAFNVSSSGACALEVGDTVVLTKSGQTQEASITQVSTTADSSSGLFPVKASLVSGDSGLLSGVSVKVTASTAKEENALLVPNSVVYYQDNQPYVFLYDNGKARQTFFTAGISTADNVIAADGLSESDQIITTWHPDLKDGADVLLAEGEASVPSQAADREEAAVPEGAANTVPEGNE